MNKYSVENIPEPFRTAFEIETESTIQVEMPVKTQSENKTKTEQFSTDKNQNDLSASEAESPKHNYASCQRNSPDLTQAFILLFLLDII